ncbi:MAG: FAD-dependent oxidoreductase [Planctomycetes bacterium]|nr:FAD-dependent oxidoreductase [Planctomycetota bacterium]
MSRYTKPPASVDVLIIGGGVNGCGLARDLALRGIKCAVLEKRDISTGATGGCSGMIHGGPRYLISDRNTTFHSCVDAGHIKRIASYMIFRIPFIVPVLKTEKRAKSRLEQFETFFAEYDKFSHLKDGKEHRRLTGDEVRAAMPGASDDIIGGVTFDEWGIDPFRLCVQNAVDASRHAATIHTYTEVTDFVVEAGVVKGAAWRDTITGERGLALARVIVNLTGPWSPTLLRKLGIEMKMRPGKGIHLILDRRLSNYAMHANALDGRSIFIMPHENSSLIGTTDDDYFGDPDDIPVTRDEVEYLFAGIESVLPKVRENRVMRIMKAVRPTIYAYGKLEDDLSRDYDVIDHERDGAKNLISMIGGKLAAYRLMCEDLGNRVADMLGVQTKSTTHERVLPGAESESSADDVAREFGISFHAASRIVARHGSNARNILGAAKDDDRKLMEICGCEPVTWAELEYCIKNEFVRHPSDLRRRCTAGTGPDQGRNCAFNIAALFAEHSGAQGSTTDHLIAFLNSRFRSSKFIASTSAAAETEITRMAYLVSGNIV